MKLTIPFKTPTINHLYGQRGFRKFLTKEAKEIKEEIWTLIAGNKEIYNFVNKPLKVVIKIYENWYTQNDEVARKDISNREKFLIDSIFEAMGIDDKYIFEHTMIKEQDYDNEYAEVEINEISFR